MTLDCSGREALDDWYVRFICWRAQRSDFRSSIGAQYGEFLGNSDNVGELLEEYFTVRGYQKGTVHIVFKRPDLVEKLNDIIARHYRCIAATSLIKQKSHSIYAGAFFL